jgi:hypothetical protein
LCEAGAASAHRTDKAKMRKAAMPREFWRVVLIVL